MIGNTSKSEREWLAWVDAQRARFRMHDYNTNLIAWNCNNFCDEVAQFLRNTGNPQ